MERQKNIIIIILKFEGEYLNAENSGKAKEYYDNNKLKFEGEYLNGEKMEKQKSILKTGN